jgi:type II secretory pathway pseudopilin PulG
MKLHSRIVRCRRTAGMTIVEVLIALFILSAITSAVVSLIVTGDRIAGRRTGVSYATTIAKNEAERIRSSESASVLPGDTVYSDTVNGIEFEVSRTLIGGNVPPPRDSVILYQEYAVSVKRKLGSGLGFTFRMLQGYNGIATR